ncbi:MAG: hypothetical protein LUF00_09280 [Lachnospiraceae bacterium]|nr:hypothetical protein [Lachnospiraceae bacterium]
MAEEKRRKVAFPLFSHYNLPIKYFIETSMNAEYILQPPMTRRTMDLGARYSPDSVCTPFKTTLGSMIEALEAGADTLIMTMGVCRLGYYGELQEEILRRQGYDFDFVNFSEYATGKPKDYLKVLRQVDPKLSLPKMTRALTEALRMVAHLDEIEELYYKNCGFEVHPGDYRKTRDHFLMAMQLAAGSHDIEEGYKTVKREMAAIPLKKPDRRIRVGVIGEYYTVMDPFSNLNLEQKLADMGVEVHRWMNVSNRNLHYHEKNLRVQIGDYCEYNMGPTSTANIWAAKYYASHGFDGIVHVKSAGCTPETDIEPVLRRIGAEYRIPILYLTYDTQTSDTGLDTRLEAFYDML